LILFTRAKALILASVLLFLTSHTEAKGIDSRQIKCLTDNAYFESRGEPQKGQVAVIYTTLNRAASGKFPSDICSVVYQRNQFSWTSNKNRPIKEKELYQEIKETVHEVIQGKHEDVTNGATYFHASSIKKPKDFGNVRCTARIGGHVFYKPSK
jgi:spore germination cell wall hydrolase CwlJ-like protein